MSILQYTDIPQGPNPWKTAIMLEELGVEYEHKQLQFPEMKQEPFESVNPNGRVPAIVDPNTGVTMWESGAIIEYLVETYDKDKKFSYDSSPEKWLTKTWLHFQMSGQGPYFGQKAWFSMFHPEKIPSAIERYEKEVKRVVGVIDRHLKKNGTEYLVGDKCTYADLAFIPWNTFIPNFGLDVDVAKEYPNFHAWNDRLTARPAVKKVLEAWGKAKAQQH